MTVRCIKLWPVYTLRRSDWLLYITGALAASWLVDACFAITLCFFPQTHRDDRKGRRNGAFPSLLAMKIVSSDGFYRRELKWRYGNVTLHFVRAKIRLFATTCSVTTVAGEAFPLRLYGNASCILCLIRKRTSRKLRQFVFGEGSFWT